MKNRSKFKEISRLRTSDLLVSKMSCTENVAWLQSFKLGLIGLLGMFLGQIAKTMYTHQDFTFADYLSVVFMIFCVIEYLLLNALEARSTAKKELINDLLAIRISRTGKKS